MDENGNLVIISLYLSLGTRILTRQEAEGRKDIHFLFISFSLNEQQELFLVRGNTFSTNANNVNKDRLNLLTRKIIRFSSFILQWCTHNKWYLTSVRQCSWTKTRNTASNLWCSWTLERTQLIFSEGSHKTIFS